MSLPPTSQRRFLRLAGPNILSNLLVPLAGLVDTGLLGHLAAVPALGGVALATVLFDYVFWTFGFLRMSTTGLVAQCRGRASSLEELRTGLRALIVAAIAGGSILLLRGPLESLGFAVLGGSHAVEVAGRAYFRWRILGAPFALMNFALLGWLLGREDSRGALLVAAVGHGINILLDLLFIARLGWGAAGAGAATAISQVAMFAAGSLVLTLSGERLPWRQGLHPVADLLNPQEWRRFFTLSADITVRTLALVSTFAVFTNIAATLGELALAATAILRSVVMVLAYFVDGFAFATESLAGVYYGAKDSLALRRLLRTSLLWGVGVAGGSLCLFLFSPRTWLGLLTDHAQVLDLAHRHALWLIPVLLLSAPAYIYDGYFLGMSRGSLLRRAMLVSCLVGFVPVALWAWRAADLDILWLALSLFMAARTWTLGRVAHRPDPAASTAA